MKSSARDPAFQRRKGGGKTKWGISCQEWLWGFKVAAAAPAAKEEHKKEDEESGMAGLGALFG